MPPQLPAADRAKRPRSGARQSADATRWRACDATAGDGPGSWVVPDEEQEPMPRRTLTHALMIAAAVPALALPAAAQAATIDGTPRGERLLGTAQADTIRAFEGADRVLARAGDDTVDGGFGADLLRGNAGNDTIQGGNGPDLITGNLGDDTLDGGPGRDAVFGGKGNDRVSGGDPLAGPAGRFGWRLRGPFWGSGERLHGGAGNDVVTGGAGRDFLSGGFDDDRVEGGAGGDRIFANKGVDTVLGGDGNDDLWALSRKDVSGPGDTVGDTLDGGAGNDLFHTYDGEADRIGCGDGRDRVIADVHDAIADATPENPNGSCERVTRTQPESDQQEGATEAPADDQREGL
jgi:hypothetical protein